MDSRRGGGHRGPSLSRVRRSPSHGRVLEVIVMCSFMRGAPRAARVVPHGYPINTQRIPHKYPTDTPRIGSRGAREEEERLGGLVVYNRLFFGGVKIRIKKTPLHTQRGDVACSFKSSFEEGGEARRAMRGSRGEAGRRRRWRGRGRRRPDVASLL